MKVLTLLISVLVLSLTVPHLASAQVQPFEKVCDEKTAGSSVCQTDGTKDPLSGENGVILRAVDIVSYMSGFAAVVMIVIAGLKFITANGDSNSVASARNTVIYAMIGIVILILSQTIVKFVISKV